MESLTMIVENHLPIVSSHHKNGFGCFVNLASSILIPPKIFYVQLCIYLKWLICFANLKRLQAGVSLIRMFNDNLSAEWAVWPSSIKVAIIPNEASANAILFCDQIVAKINDIKNVFPVPPGTSTKKISASSIVH